MSSGTFTPVDVHSAMQSASFHGFAPQEVQRSQKSQHLWDNCFPPGVEPEPNPASSGAMLQTHLPVQMQTSQLQQPQLQQQQIQQYPQQLVHPHPHAPPYPHTHPHLPLNMQTYHPQQQQQQRTPFGFNMRTSRASEKMRPKRKAAKESSKQVPVVKSTSTDETRTGTEKGPGWCSVCQTRLCHRSSFEAASRRKGLRKPLCV
ncbi:hypothetical protein KP509_20G009000 [Ceratopteris richardii]|uniref:Uncharacterized protein n=1 Tax=Ceratopteris richardii TaxID=49495 RepID=A0A8T2SDI4_CERRI|nr:hypothetical protein KP509_20G009000 [Ceratopteris richardii]